MREKSFLPARQKHDAEFESLRRVQRHQRDAIAVAALIGIHHQRYMLEETLQRVEVVHETHELLEVLETRLRLRALVGLPHRRIAGLIQRRARRDRYGACD